MTDSGERVSPNATAKVKVKLGLGSSIFRPNATVTATTYHTVLIVEIVALIGLWLFSASFLPTPMKVIEAFFRLINEQGLIGELWSSLALNLQAITLSTGISLLLSYATAIPVFRPLATAISKLRFLSLVGLSFVATMIVGGGYPLKLTLLTFGMTVFFVTSMVDVVQQVPSADMDYVRTLRSGEWRVLWEARIMGTLGQAFDIMRQNAAMGWLMLTMVEGMVRSDGGIGKLLLDQEKHFSLSAIIAVQAVFLTVGILQDTVIAWLKTIFAPWASLSYSKDKK